MILCFCLPLLSKWVMCNTRINHKMVPLISCYSKKAYFLWICPITHTLDREWWPLKLKHFGDMTHWLSALHYWPLHSALVYLGVQWRLSTFGTFLETGLWLLGLVSTFLCMPTVQAWKCWPNVDKREVSAGPSVPTLSSCKVAMMSSM